MRTAKVLIERQISFRCDGLRLQGTLHLPERINPPVVVGSHGLFSSSRSPKQISLAKACCQQGIAFFRFDHRGCGESEGDFRTVTSLAGRRLDLLKAIETVQAQPDLGHTIGLFGSSFGGAVCISAASDCPVEAIVTFAAPVDSESILEAIKHSAESALFKPLGSKPSFHFDLSDRLKNLHHILLFHGETDEIVPISHADDIFAQALEPKKIIRQPKGDHRMSAPTDQQIFLHESAHWFNSWLSAGHAAP